MFRLRLMGVNQVSGVKLGSHKGKEQSSFEKRKHLTDTIKINILDIN